MDEQMMQQILQLVQAAQQGDQQAVQLIQQIKQAAQQGDQQAVNIMQIIQKMLTLKAAKGAKLNYLKRLNGVCPEGYTLLYHKMGGQICQTCVKALEGAKTKKAKNSVEEFKANQAQKRSLKKVNSTKTSNKLPNGKYPSNWTTAQRIEWERNHGDNDEGAHIVKNKGIGKNACGAKIKK